jgi:hypothetical protein
MTSDHPTARPARVRRRCVRAALTVSGGLVAVLLVGGFGEAYLRLFPPRDSHAYLGDGSPQTGPFAPDTEFGATYRSWQAFCEENPSWRRYLPPKHPADSRPVWAFFGNSFVQAPGMLADTASAALPSRCVFHLGRNELLCIRLAQVRLLLDHGLNPERIFVALMPLDTVGLGRDPLASVYVTARGAITYRPRLPGGPLGALTARSALARTAWFRAGRHHAHPDFRGVQLNDGLGDELRADLDHLFAALARTAAEHGTPVTVLLIPNHEQITCAARFGFQDAMAPLLRRHGIDVCDVRGAFLSYPEKPGLFIPDKHFSAVGNRLLLDELLRHLRGIGAPLPAEADPT